MALDPTEEASIRKALESLPKERVDAVVATMNGGLGPNEDNPITSVDVLGPVLTAIDAFTHAMFDREKLRADKAEAALAQAIEQRDAVTATVAMQGRQLAAVRDALALT